MELLSFSLNGVLSLLGLIWEFNPIDDSVGNFALIILSSLMLVQGSRSPHGHIGYEEFGIRCSRTENLFPTQIISHH